MGIKSIEQERAGFCLKRIKKMMEEFNEEEDKKKRENIKNEIDKFKAGAKKLPALIVSNGLIPVLAFYKQSGSMKIYGILDGWLKKKGLITSDALEDTIDASQQNLMIITAETLAVANWLKRMAEVNLGSEESEEKK
ncbi:MAG: type III-B CRISPR module-associated protein Cmr5 [Tepidanaerobacteraceae bacterium]|jgi:CRISPR-associated protein Cmr5|nr:type III-B CRISPR module-associated protein Cmr5 [Tepidanaerobacteraceae bacterium]